MYIPPTSNRERRINMSTEYGIYYRPPRYTLKELARISLADTWAISGAYERFERVDTKLCYAFSYVCANTALHIVRDQGFEVPRDCKDIVKAWAGRLIGKRTHRLGGRRKDIKNARRRLTRMISESRRAFSVREERLMIQSLAELCLGFTESSAIHAAVTSLREFVAVWSWLHHKPDGITRRLSQEDTVRDKCHELFSYLCQVWYVCGEDTLRRAIEGDWPDLIMTPTGMHYGGPFTGP